MIVVVASLFYLPIPFIEWWYWGTMRPFIIAFMSVGFGYTLFFVSLFVILLRSLKPWKFYENGIGYHALFGKPRFLAYGDIRVAVVHISRNGTGLVDFHSKEKFLWSHKTERLPLRDKRQAREDASRILRLLEEKGVDVKRSGRLKRE